MTPLTCTRLPIRDRAHAGEIARQLSLGDLLKNGGAVDGFADWLFVERKTFNGRNPLQQAAVYANRCRYASKRGADFDALCRERADQKEQSWERARAEFQAEVAAVEAWWSETPVGADITLAVTELCLGRGNYFAVSPDGDASSEAQPSWVLEWLLKELEAFGGSDNSLDKYEWSRQTSEDNFRRLVDRRGKKLTSIRERIARGRGVAEVDLLTIAQCTSALSRVSRIRASLRALLTRATMVERIRFASPTPSSDGPPERRSRDV